MSRAIKNTTGADVSIDDIGITIPANTTWTAPIGEYKSLAASNDIETLINAGTLVVNDGLDDLKAAAGIQFLRNEDYRVTNMDVATDVRATANSTLTLTVASKTCILFTGSTAGQVVKLGDAQTYNVGRRYEFINSSSKTIVIKNYNDSVLGTLNPYVNHAVCICQDNSSAGGTWTFSSRPITPYTPKYVTLQFGYAGSMAANTAMYIGNSVTASGLLVPGAGYITSICVTNNATLGAGTSAKFELRYKSGVSTWGGYISGAEVTLAQNTRYTVANDLWIPITADYELQYIRTSGARGDGGGTITDVTAVINIMLTSPT